MAKHDPNKVRNLYERIDIDEPLNHSNVCLMDVIRAAVNCKDAVGSLEYSSKKTDAREFSKLANRLANVSEILRQRAKNLSSDICSKKRSSHSGNAHILEKYREEQGYNK